MGAFSLPPSLIGVIKKVYTVIHLEQRKLLFGKKVQCIVQIIILHLITGAHAIYTKQAKVVWNAGIFKSHINTGLAYRLRSNIACLYHLSKHLSSMFHTSCLSIIL